MRGISAIVELLLITLLLISLVSLLWLFTSGTINVIARSGTNQTQRTQEIFSTCMIVDSVYGNTVYLKNCGYGVITNDSLGVYLDDTPLKFNMTPQKIGKGGVGTININSADLLGISKGYHNLKITNPNSQTVQSVEAVLPDSVVLALNFDEGSGTIAYDSSGNGNDGNLLPSGSEPQWIEGKFNRALKFNGINSYVDVPDSTSLNPTNEITVAFWAKALSPIDCDGNNNWRWPLTKGYWNDYHIIFEDIGGGFVFTIKNSVGSDCRCWSNTGVIPVGEWHHYAGTYSASTGQNKVYYDGNLINTCSCSALPIQDTIQDLYINNNRNSACPQLDGNFNGTIDSVRIFNQALTPDQTIVLKMK